LVYPVMRPRESLQLSVSPGSELSSLYTPKLY
jgi:hypothetical protein